MFCGSCGASILEGAVLCPICGKSPKGVATNESKTGNYPLISLSAKLYTVFFEIGLWLLLIFGPNF